MERVRKKRDRESKGKVRDKETNGREREIERYRKR
jgi:hypothetical protein